MRHLTESDFEGAIADHGLFLVAFTAKWCAPCGAMYQVYKELEGEHLGVGLVDVEVCPRLTARLRIRTVPTVILFKGGVPANMRTGSDTLDGMRRWLKSNA